ncbi:hypothetical protein NMK34_08780 [Micromonospora sp. BRA006-A]|uniref:hypothetical protein n=1 Tax=unclassified Micromonospora TaxID=2617518 RepID=UPI00296F8D80|nr:hypothetical protein [Micromonospora sp. BRA006-A]MDW3846699.1 hypothetical protein [Micromonospora sp. BRA006-A]
MGNALLEREYVVDDVQALQELAELDPSVGIAAAGCCCMVSALCGLASVYSWVTCGTCTNTDN